MDEQLTIKRTLELAIATEELGAKFYEQLAAKFSDDRRLASLFKQLALEEQDHSGQFEGLLESAPVVEEDALDDETAGRLRKLAAIQYFSSGEGPFVGVDEVDNEKDGLAHSLTFEEATLELYLTLRDIFGRNETLDALVNTERSHVARLQDVLATLRTQPAVAATAPAEKQQAVEAPG